MEELVDPVDVALVLAGPLVALFSFLAFYTVTTTNHTFAGQSAGTYEHYFQDSGGSSDSGTVTTEWFNGWHSLPGGWLAAIAALAASLLLGTARFGPGLSPRIPVRPAVLALYAAAALLLAIEYLTIPRDALLAQCDRHGFAVAQIAPALHMRTCAELVRSGDLSVSVGFGWAYWAMVMVVVFAMVLCLARLHPRAAV